MKTIPLALKTYPPNMPRAILQGCIRGVINLRGRVIPLIDLRKRMGLPSAADETKAFCDLLDQRERDHRKWLDELEASLAERRAFALTSDALGKWYDGYRAQNPWGLRC